jgi:molybdopterin/thiamine biosynthesis adenylyltransferase
MAFANFFEKSSASAAEVLADFDHAEFCATLERQVVGLAYNRDAQGLEGRKTLDLCVRLLARLYPKIAICALEGASVRLGRELRRLARAINPKIEIMEDPADVAIGLTVGDARAGFATEVFIGSDRWIANVSTSAPVGSGRSGNPFGAGAAACLGAANVFRAIFGDQLKGARLDGDARLSLLDFSTGPDALNGPLPDALDLTSVSLVGLGAIGNAALWALARTPGLTGTPHLIEPEPVELSNLQRYVLALQRHIGHSKLQIAQEAFADSDLTPQLFHETWAGYVEGRGHARLERVVVGLDTARDRLQVQAALPRRILNAWTQSGDLGVSRHDFLEGACLACLYLPDGQVPSEDSLIAEAVGLGGPQHRMRIRELLHSGAPVGGAFVAEVAGKLGVDPEDLAGFASEPLRAFYRQAMCGGLILQLGGKAAPAEAPIAFQSALAGVMLAAELMVDLAGLRATPARTKTVVNLLRPLTSQLGVMVAKPQRANGIRCFCEDEDFRTAYRQRHPDGSASTTSG